MPQGAAELGQTGKIIGQFRGDLDVLLGGLCDQFRQARIVEDTYPPGLSTIAASVLLAIRYSSFFAGL